MTRQQRGAAFLIVMWLLALLAIILGAFALLARSERLQARHLYDTTQARYAAEAGVHRAVFSLAIPDPMQRWVPDGRPYRFEFGNAEIEVEITDETGKIDLNAADAIVLGRFFEGFDLPMDEANALAAAIIDWRDPDDLESLNGAEAEAYEAEGLDYGPRNAPFEMIGELQQVLGMNYALYERVAPYLTLYSGLAMPNPAFAAAQVLQALPGMDPVLAEQALQARFGYDPLLGGEPAVLADGTPLVVTAGSGTYSIRSRARLQNGAWTELDTAVRLGGVPVSGLAFSVLRWQDGAYRRDHDLTTLPFADALTPLLGRLSARYQQSRLPEFFAWWFGELRGLLPQRWQEYLRVQQTHLLLRRQADGLVQVQAAEGGVVEQVGSLAADDIGEVQLATLVGEATSRNPRTLLLPTDAVLVRRLSFPAAAAGNIRSLVGFEIDRQTPFKPEQVEFDCRLLPAEKGARQVSVELAVVTRDRLDAELAALGDMAGRLDAVDVLAANGRAGFNLLPTARRRPHDHRPLLINLAMLALAIGLLLAAMGQLVENRRAAVVSLEAQVEERRVEARRTAQLRKTLEEAATAANFLSEHKAQRPTTISLLRDLTDILPDDTFLERLTIAGPDLSLTVQSASAAKLIELFQSSARFSDPTLLGAVQPDSRTGKDRATLTVKVAAETGGSP